MLLKKSNTKKEMWKQCYNLIIIILNVHTESNEYLYFLQIPTSWLGEESIVAKIWYCQP